MSATGNHAQTTLADVSEWGGAGGGTVLKYTNRCDIGEPEELGIGSLPL